jgi:hypothetical protein
VVASTPRKVHGRAEALVDDPRPEKVVEAWVEKGCGLNDSEVVAFARAAASDPIPERE